MQTLGGYACVKTKPQANILQVSLGYFITSPITELSIN
jgi:hypothetical protein